MGWLLVFRTNTAYARWWEARTLRSGLVNCSRNIAVKLNTLLPVGLGERNLFRQGIIGFADALRDHLRDQPVRDRRSGFANETDRPLHLPAYLVEQMYQQLGRWRAEKQLQGDELRVLDEELRRFLDFAAAANGFATPAWHALTVSLRGNASSCFWERFPGASSKTSAGGRFR